MAGVAGAGLLLAPSLDACVGKPAQENFRLIETINLAVPGLTAEKYKVEFDEMFVPFWTKQQIQSWLKDNRSNRDYRGGGDPLKGETHWTVSSKCGVSFIGYGRIKLFGGFSNEFYFDGNTNKFYENVLPYRVGGMPNKAEQTDMEMLGWPDVSTTYYASEHISCNGKVLYGVYPPSYNDPLKHLPSFAIIIADVPNSSKVVIKDKESVGNPIVGRLSKEGNKLLLSFGYQSEDKSRGSYLIDLSSWRVIFHSDIASREPFLNKDGSLLYVSSGQSRDQFGYVYDTNTGEEKDFIWWPASLTSYEHVPSSNFNFIARTVGEFAAMTTVEGQWGIYAHTPEGIFHISSPQKSLIPTHVDDDGTIYTYDSIFKFANGTYQLSETAEREKFDVLINKVRNKVSDK